MLPNNTGSFTYTHRVRLLMKREFKGVLMSIKDALKKIIRKYKTIDYILFSFVLIIAFTLKSHYSAAGPNELLWILGPTAALTQFLSGIPFVYEAGEGFINYNIMISIAKPCAGINFLIVSFTMSCFAIIPMIRQKRFKALSVVSVMISTYCISVVVNAVRIVTAVFLYNNNVHYGWMSGERIHRLEGILIYFIFLWIIYYVICKKGKRLEAVNAI